MGKKGKKKTVASTKRVVKTDEQLEQERKEKKLLRKIFRGVSKSMSKKELMKRKEKTEPEGKSAELAPKPEAVKMKEVMAAEPSKEHHEKAKHASKALAAKDLARAEKIAAKEEARKMKMEEKMRRLEEKKKKKRSRKPILSEGHRQKMKGIVMVLIGVFMLGFAGYFLFTKFFRPESLAKLLPDTNTIGFVELNIDGQSDQAKNFTQLFQKYAVYQPENLAKLLSLLTPVNYDTDLAPWIGRKIGIALMKESQNDDTVKLVLFVESKDTAKTVDFLKTRAVQNNGDQLLMDDYNGSTIYRYKLGQNFEGTFINNYLVLSGSDTIIKQLIDSQNGNIVKLQDDQLFQKVNNNLPTQGLMDGYINLQQFFDTMMKNPAFESQKLHDFVQLQPFMKIFAAEGFTMVATDNNVTVQTFEAIDRSQLQGQSYLTYSDKYEGSLLELAGDAPVLFAGGHDLYKEIQRIGEVVSQGTSMDSTIFNGILEAQKDKYFGKDISLDNDIYPLLKNEYLVTVENNFVDPQVTVFLNLTDKNQDMLSIEKLANAFMQQRAIFSPEVKDVTLPDGTKGQEIVASAENITRSDNAYGGYNVTTLQLGSLPWSINYAVLDNTLVISTSPASLNSVIDRKNGKISTNLRVSDDFTQNILPYMRSADEIFNIKLGALIPVLGLDQNEMVKPYVEPFGNLTMAKNYFDDGISTLYVIGVI